MRRLVARFGWLTQNYSADLVVSSEVPGAVNTTIASGVAYGAGEARGFVNTAELVLDDFVVDNQAYRELPIRLHTF